MFESFIIKKLCEKLAVQTLNEAISELNRNPMNFNPPQVELEKWRPVYYKMSTQDNIDSKRKSFSRVRRTLEVKGWLKVDNDIYTLTLPDNVTCP